MSTQERIDIQARNGRVDSATGRPAAGAGRADRLPRPPGRRRPGLAVIAVLLIVLGGAVAGLLAMRIDDRVPVLVARQQINVGHQITRDDLAVAEIASSGIDLIHANQASQVVGKYATGVIAPGRLIDAKMLSTTGLLGAGYAAVGVALEQGRYPASGLESGDTVQVVRSVEGVGKVLADDAIVEAIQTPGDSVFGSSGNNTTVITVIVNQADAPAVAAAALSDQVSLVLLHHGPPPGGG